MYTHILCVRLTKPPTRISTLPESRNPRSADEWECVCPVTVCVHVDACQGNSKWEQIELPQLPKIGGGDSATAITDTWQRARDTLTT